jgi:hypothetical protein
VISQPAIARVFAVPEAARVSKSWVYAVPRLVREIEGGTAATADERGIVALSENKMNVRRRKMEYKRLRRERAGD